MEPTEAVQNIHKGGIGDLKKVAKGYYQRGHSGPGQRGRSRADALAHVAHKSAVEVGHGLGFESDLSQDVVHLGERVSGRVAFDLKKLSYFRFEFFRN